MNTVKFEVCQMLRHQVEGLVWKQVDYKVWDQVMDHCVMDTIVDTADNLIYFQLHDPI